MAFVGARVVLAIRIGTKCLSFDREAKIRYRTERAKDNLTWTDGPTLVRFIWIVRSDSWGVVSLVARRRLQSVAGLSQRAPRT